PMGEMIAFGHVSGAISVYQVDENDDYTLLHEINAAHDGPVNTIQFSPFSPDGSLLVSGGADGMMRFWNAADGTSIWDVSAHDSGVEAVTFAANGHVMASGGTDGSLVVWAVPTVPPFE
ncbi:MAG: hypothetical protein IAF02_26290, partial [Anaerolineae bacterium]|nr:hypothetical protein [Anaerolineae bacterium]